MRIAAQEGMNFVNYQIPKKPVRQLLIPAVAAGAVFLSMPAQAAPASIAGKWKTDDGRSVISIYPCGKSMCGKIDRFLVKEPRGGARDTKNPNKSLRSRRLLGLRIFWNMKPKGNSWDGKGYSPEDGRIFNSSLKRVGNKLKVKGCVLVICRTVTWTKA